MRRERTTLSEPSGAMNYSNKFSTQPKRPGSVGQNWSANQGHRNNDVNKATGPKVPGVRQRAVHPDLSIPLSRLTIKKETVDEQRKRLWKELNKFESPFIWAPKHVKPIDSHEAAVARLKEKDEEVKDEKRFKWRKFIFHLVISYESLLAGHPAEEVLAGLDTLEQVLQKQTDTNVEWLFLGVQHALKHIVEASKAYVYLTTGQLQNAARILERVLPVDCLKPASRAAVHGVRAAVFSEYGHTGNKRAAKEALQAVSLDRTNPEWHFLLGKCLGRIRRVATCHELVTEDEVKAIKTALHYDKKNALYKVYLAQMLREKAFRELRLHQWKTDSPEYKAIYKTYYAAKYLYKEAVELQPNCPHILTRCAFGLMKLPPNLVQLPEVRNHIDKALELAPRNMMTHHIKAIYYERFTTELEVALQEMEIAAELGNFGAAIDLVRMHYLMKQDGIAEELLSLASQFGESCCVQVTLTQAGSYLLFVKKDLLRAVQCFIKVLEIDPNSYAMMSHKSKFVRMKYPVNLFEVLYEELDHRTDRNSFSREDNKVLTNLRVLIKDHVPIDNRECLSVERILEMAHHRTNFEQRERKKKVRKWKGKDKRKVKKIKHDKEKDQKQNMKTAPVDKHYQRKHDKEKDQKQNKKTAPVDKHYQRNPAIYGIRDLFNVTDVRECERNKQSYRARADTQHASESSSRASSVSCSSYSSGPDISDQLSRFNLRPEVTHNSRFSQSQADSRLTVENLRLFNAANSSWTKPQGSSSCSSVGTQSVLERVSQSYAKLGQRSNNTRQGKKKYRSESTQAVTRSGNSPDQDSLDRSFSRMSLQRTGSTQSLNIPSTTETSLSQLFMPSFTRKPTDRDNENRTGNKSSSLFLPRYAKKREESDKS